MNTRRHSLFSSDGFRPALSAGRKASAPRLLAALACCCLLAAPRPGLAATPQAARALPAAPATAAAPQRNPPAPVQETRAASPPVAMPPAADAVNASGVDAQGRAAWRTLETGLLFGEFRLNDGDAKLTVVRIDPAYFDFTLCSRSQDGGPSRSLSQWGEQYDLAAAINASMYLPDGSTSTGYMRQGGHVNNGRVVQRFGAFFVAGPDTLELPSAAILDRDAPQWRQTLDHYSLVIQNYRMINADRRILWSPGGPHYSISAVAQDGDGQILFMHCRQPVEAYAFAQQVLHLPLNVRTVMYVEGGGQAGLLVRSASLTQELVGLNPSGFLVTGDLRAVLPNILGARRKAAPAGTGQDAPSPAETQPQNAAPQETQSQSAQPQEASPGNGQPAAGAQETGGDEPAPSAPAPEGQEQKDATPPNQVQPNAASDTAQPAAARPDTAQTGATQTTAQPDATPPEAAQPATGKTGTGQIDAGQPATAQPAPAATPSSDELPAAPTAPSLAAPAGETAEPLTEPATSLVRPSHAPAADSPAPSAAHGGNPAGDAR